MSDTNAPEPEDNQADSPLDEQSETSFHTTEHEDIVDSLRFQQIQGNSATGDKNVDRFDDVPLKVAIELGRVNLDIREILDLKEGSIIETHKLSGWPMEIIINDRLFGRGELVVVGDNLAIRITDLKKPDLT